MVGGIRGSSAIRAEGKASEEHGFFACEVSELHGSDCGGDLWKNVGISTPQENIYIYDLFSDYIVIAMDPACQC